jgi:hypothetical protein
MENGAFTLHLTRGGGEYGKNGMMQEPKRAKCNLMISSLRRIFDCSKIYLISPLGQMDFT